MCISHRRKGIQSNTFLSGEIVKWVSKMKHIGNIIKCNLKEIDDIIRKTGDFIGCVNKVFVKFRKAPESFFRIS